MYEALADKSLEFMKWIVRRYQIFLHLQSRIKEIECYHVKKRENNSIPSQSKSTSQNSSTQIMLMTSETKYLPACAAVRNLQYRQASHLYGIAQSSSCSSGTSSSIATSFTFSAAFLTLSTILSAPSEAVAAGACIGI